MMPIIHRSGKVILARKNIIVEIIAALFILLFVYTALSKLMDYNTFRYQLQLYPFISKFGGIISWAVPTIELIVAATLLIPIARIKRIGLYASMFMMIGFTIYLILMILFGGKDLPCSCGGVIQKLTWKQHIIFNVFFAGLALLALWLQKHSGGGAGSTGKVSLATS